MACQGGLGAKVNFIDCKLAVAVTKKIVMHEIAMLFLFRRSLSSWDIKWIKVELCVSQRRRAKIDFKRLLANFLPVLFIFK